MNYLPINYDTPLFRPPSEAYSLILQLTLGCSWNRCSFCEMYSTKKFKVRNPNDIIDEINQIASIDSSIQKIFLADGDAMVLSTPKLIKILDSINSNFPRIRRISAYAKPKDLSTKTINELKQLKDSGLSMVYVGIESGDNELLKLVNKGETFDSTVKGLLNAKNAGIKSSVMVLNGLGGQVYSEQHAINSAKVINITQPEFASTLVLSFPFGENHYKDRFNGEYKPMNTIELIKELKIFIETTELNSTVFRSDHASNYLVLKGILSKDKNKILNNIDFAINNIDKANLREEWQRGL